MACELKARLSSQRFFDDSCTDFQVDGVTLRCIKPSKGEVVAFGRLRWGEQPSIVNAVGYELVGNQDVTI